MKQSQPTTPVPPDPNHRYWKQQNKTLKKQGISKQNRPKRPAPNPKYPTKPDLTVQMIEDFVKALEELKVDSVLADLTQWTNEIYGYRFKTD